MPQSKNNSVFDFGLGAFILGLHILSASPGTGQRHANACADLRTTVCVSVCRLDLDLFMECLCKDTLQCP